MFTVAQVEQAFREWYVQEDDSWPADPDDVSLESAYEEYDFENATIKTKWGGEIPAAPITSVGQILVVDSYGGEGRGDTYYKVFRLVDTDQYFRVDGWYASYDGGYLDGDLYEVKPTPKTITVYTPVES